MSLLIPGDQMPTAGTADVPWLIKPYIPREGIIFLYGKKGVGKSPLTWSLAQAVSTGAPWLGLPVQTTGTVLYIEVDSPLSVVKLRTDHLTFSSNVCFYFPSDPLICLPEGYERLKRDTGHLTPCLVIINTLRKIHAYNDKESNTPSKVYGKFRHLWPCVLFIHHEKKTPADPEQQIEEGEEYSGSLAWHNDAQVCLQVKRAPGPPAREGHNLTLVNTGNQLHLQPPGLKFSLSLDGFSIKPRN